MALVTVTDLREYMSGVSLNAGQMRTAQAVLDGTQETLELYLNRPVQPVQIRERRLSNSQGDLILSVTPVYKVISVRSLGQDTLYEPSSDTTALSEEEVDRVVDNMAVTNSVVPGGIYVGTTSAWYIVEYIGGYNGYVDNALKLAILEVASRTMTVNHDDTLTIKADMASEPSGGGISQQKGWTDDELKRFDRLRRRVAYR
jgi:hypothetical protein